MAKYRAIDGDKVDILVCGRDGLGGIDLGFTAEQLIIPSTTKRCQSTLGDVVIALRKYNILMFCQDILQVRLRRQASPGSRRHLLSQHHNASMLVGIGTETLLYIS